MHTNVIFYKRKPTTCFDHPCSRHEGGDTKDKKLKDGIIIQVTNIRRNKMTVINTERKMHEIRW